MRLFVTGIGTDVGKTIASAVLTEALQADYWKPVQTGNAHPDSRTIASLVSNSKTVIHPEAYSFKAPVSPHLAAALEQVYIDMDRIHLPATANHLIIEGAGGLLVPLNDEHYAIDLAKKLEAEVVLVIRNYLGCINHALLSIDYLARHRFHVKGLVLNGAFEPAVRKAIVDYAQIPVLAELAGMEPLNRDTIREQASHIYLNVQP